MSAAADHNDQVIAGKFKPPFEQDKIKPMNEAAKVRAEEMPRVLSVKQIIAGAYERTISREERKFCTAGHWRLDEATGGMRPGHVWVFGAETNWGKSSWLVSIADENIRRGKRVLIVSAEDDESLYGDRLLARRARVNYTRMRDGRLQQAELDAVSDVVNQAEDIPVFLDARGKRIETVCKQVDALVKREKIDLVAYDYLQEFRTEKRYQDERVKFRDIASQLRGTIKDNSITGVIFSQITVSDAKKTPDKHSIRESRDVSNAAEVVALGFTPDEDIIKDGQVIAHKDSKCIKIDKAKDGQKRAVEMHWDHSSACFLMVSKPDEYAGMFDDQLDTFNG